MVASKAFFKESLRTYHGKPQNNRKSSIWKQRKTAAETFVILLHARHTVVEVTSVVQSERQTRCFR